MDPRSTKVSARERRTAAEDLLGLVVAVAVWLAASPALGQSDEGAAVSWSAMTIGLFGGLALFLYGMERMAGALKMVAGNKMREVLRRLTSNRIVGLITGAVVTAVIQSSSVTTVMLVGFVSAGLMSLSQAIGVILGADIGTTITSQIIAFKVSKYALVFVALGFLAMTAGKKHTTQQYGVLVMGLGLIFFGMGVMSDAMHPLRSHAPFLELMHGVSNPVVGILLATAFTGLVQSSSATMGVVIALASQGLISLEGGIALALGANIGTCVTAGLAAIGKPREAVRVAVAHVTFKVVGVLMIVGFVPWFADLVRQVSPAAPAGLSQVDRLADEAPRQIANAHTLFNVGIAVLFLPLAPLFARFCEWVVPDSELSDVDDERSHLDMDLLTNPALALVRARFELGRLGEQVQSMLEQVFPAVLEGDYDALDEVQGLDDRVDTLYGQIVTYLGRVGQQQLAADQALELSQLIEVANALENIGDVIETDLVTLGRRRIDTSVTVSESTAEVLGGLHRAVSDGLDAALRALATDDAALASEVIEAKGEIAQMASSAAVHQVDRLVADEPNRLAAYAVETDIVERLRRIFYFAKRIAKIVIPRGHRVGSAG